ncbi:MAG: hypothetical protein R2792_00255 [Saprospiraceae bacterium]
MLRHFRTHVETRFIASECPLVSNAFYIVFHDCVGDARVVRLYDCDAISQRVVYFIRLFFPDH